MSGLTRIFNGKSEEGETKIVIADFDGTIALIIYQKAVYSKVYQKPEIPTP